MRHTKTFADRSLQLARFRIQSTFGYTYNPTNKSRKKRSKDFKLKQLNEAIRFLELAMEEIKKGL